MEQRTALITGAAGAIGTALCRAFRAAGFSVIGTDKEKCEGGVCDRFVGIDLALLVEDASYREQAMRNISEAIGNDRLDVLVNNAAVQIVADVDALDVDDWRESLNVNVVAPFVLIHAMLPLLEAARGSVVNIGSIHSRLTKPRFCCYATSKAALSGLTRSLAVELGDVVRINEITPAAIATPMLLAGFEGRAEALDRLEKMHPVGRIARPEEIAQAAVFLASAKGSFVNGASLEIDGGIGGRLHDPE